MKALQILPEGFNEICAVDMKNDKKLMWLINGLSLLIGAVMVIAMNFFVPFSSIYDMSNGITAYTIRFAVLIVSLFAYIVLHELVHGITMKHYGAKKVKYGFTGLYAFAGSDDYFPKKSYIVIALAPIVVWGIVLAAINCFVPTDYFWVVYILQVCNISGAAGDLYVTFKFRKMPADILIHDDGVSMNVYSAQEYDG